MSDWIGFWTLLKRETLRFLSLPNQTIIPSLVTTALFLLTFGFFMGNGITSVDGKSYALFIFPGLVLFNSVSAVYQNASSSLFISKWERFIEDLLVSPISFGQMVLAYVLASTARGIINVIILIPLGFFITGFHIAHPILLFITMFISSVVFAAFGLVTGLWAERWDNIAVCMNFIVTPLTFLGGVFYSSHQLPAGYAWINDFNPVYYMVSATRYAFLGSSEVSFGRSLVVTSVLALILFAWTWELFRRGYKLRT